MSKILNISSLDKSLGRFFSVFRNSNFKAHLLSLNERIWELIKKFHLKYIAWHTKIDSLSALWKKWGQNEGKILPARFQFLRAQLSHFGKSFKNFILNMVVIYENRSLSWTINKMVVYMETWFSSTLMMIKQIMV